MKNSPYNPLEQAVILAITGTEKPMLNIQLTQFVGQRFVAEGRSVGKKEATPCFTLYGNVTGFRLLRSEIGESSLMTTVGNFNLKTSGLQSVEGSDSYDLKFEWPDLDHKE